MNRCTFVAVVLAACCGLPACSPESDSAGQRLSVGARLSSDTSGFPVVTEPRQLVFPRDHGPHPQYKHEWWYLTGQVETEGGRWFGFQLTLFREALSPDPPESASRWATNQLYLAHAALTDPEGGRYLSDERFARGVLALAGASASPFRVRLADWRIAGHADAAGMLRGRAAAAAEGFAFDLDILSSRPPVAHGEGGMSAKGPAGDASYYYSYTDLATSGTIRVNGESHEVAGSSWLDHEWSSSALKSNQAGWDWFSLRLSDGSELMVFRLRDKTAPENDFYSGTFVHDTGRVTGLPNGQISMRPLDHWVSGRTGVRYPVRWRLSVPGLDLVLTTEPLLEGQEFVHSFRYWEGAVMVSGERGGDVVTGSGYVELTGYNAEGGR